MKRKEKIIGSLIVFFVLILFLAIGYFNTRQRNLTQKDMEDMFVEVNKDNSKEVSSNNSNSKSTSDNSNISSKKIVVEIKGEVKKPDVYYLNDGSIVKELISEAGGITDNADLSNINQAKKLSNNECIVIRNKSTINSQTDSKNLNTDITASLTANGDNSDLINLNTASKEDLDKLPGVGTVTADKIIEYREKNNGFKSIEDLKNVDRIGEKLFEKLKDKITVN